MTAVTVAMTIVVVMVVMMVMMMPGMIPIVVVPAPMIAVPVVGTVPVIVVIPRVVITIVVMRIIVVAVVIRIESPVPRVVYINIGVSSAVGATCIVIVVIVHGGAGVCSETFDAGCEVGIVVGLGGGVNHAIGVGHRFS